jgi:Uma2 family endonuclease
MTNIDDLDLNGTYTYADYMKWAFDETIEIIKGKVFRMSPAPNLRHQRVSLNLTGVLYNYFKKQQCNLFVAPFDVRLTPLKKDKNNKIYTVVQPDLCVICDDDKLDEHGCIGSPDLIIEILSPGNTRKEMKDKFEVYQENGVREYWLVEPNNRAVFVYVLNEQGKYFGLQPFTEEDIMTSAIFPELEINLEEVFAEK